MTTQVPVALVNAGLALPDDRKQRLFCQAFRQAIKVYCQIPKLPNRGKFNEYFFDALNNLPPPNTKAGQALAAATAREVPIISGAVCGLASNFVANPVIGTACTVAANAYAAAAALVPGAQLLPGTTGLGGLLSGSTTGLVPSSLGVGLPSSTGVPGTQTAWHQIFQNGCKITYPDGIVGNRTLELKGPHDKLRKGQAKANHQFNKHKKAFHGDGKKCGKSKAYKNCPK
ncbi:hypothetical protein WME76_17910 [Sorangium sp. So ce119]|uniref:hypothetical protein n=1 Tax=Sorangium sp. So ce119 TaxID=3133279 RepID=UPI003F5FF9C8